MSHVTDEIDEEDLLELFTREEGRFLVRARRVRVKYERDTMQIIESALEKLEALAKEAHERAISKNLPTKTRQKWAQIEAYLYQTINALIKTYDSKRILEKLEEVDERVKELVEEDSEHREQDQQSDTGPSDTSP